MLNKIKKINFKKIISLIYNLIIGLLVFIAAVTAFSVLQTPLGWRAFVVLSGSMEPKIKTGSVVFTAPKAEYRENDIITFFANPQQKDLRKVQAVITHRVVKVHDDEGRQTFTTKGDANNSADRESVTAAAVLGRVVLMIPYLGYAVAFAKTQTGLIVLIIIPATLIVYSELLNIKNEISRMVKEAKEKKGKKKTKKGKKDKK